MKKTIVPDMKSPITGGRVFLVRDTETQVFRHEKYSVHVSYYICEDTGEKFTNSNIGDAELNELYNQYRYRHGLPYPDEIRSIRLRYGLTVPQITKIAGFGQNMWRQYEAGAVPSESNGKCILAMADKNIMLTLLTRSRAELTDKEFKQIARRVEAAANNTPTNLQLYLYGNTERGPLNGYAPKNTDKLQAMVRLLVSQHNGIGATRLNKEMFYADFLHYRRYAVSISGLSYKAIQLGPVPAHYDTVYDHIDGLTREPVSTPRGVFLLFHCNEPQPEALSPEEQNTIKEVSARLSCKNTDEVINTAHREPAWRAHAATHAFIPYDEAFTLQTFE